MKRSKLLFFIIALVIAVAVSVVLVTKSGAGPEGPTNLTSPTGPVEPTNPTGDPTTPTQDATGPTSGLDLPGYLEPFFPGISTSPTEPFKPEELGAEDLPESNGKHYVNHHETNKWVALPNTDYVFSIGFGFTTESVANYLYLNPVVQKEEGDEHISLNFQFYFMPSAGHVTTIADAEYGDYRKGSIASTFVRAVDYALPAAYVSEEYPGTVWYMDEDVMLGVDEYISIDTLVYHGGELYAILRIYIVQDSDGNYYLDYVANMNQLDEVDPGIEQFEEPVRLSEEDLAWLLSCAKEDLCRENITGSLAKYYEGIEAEDLIIDAISPGKGFYFDYASYPGDVQDYYHKQVFADKELIAVTVRKAKGYYDNAFTLYYTIDRDTGVNGGDVCTLVAMDWPDLMFLKGLNQEGYPGYVKDEV